VGDRHHVDKVVLVLDFGRLLAADNGEIGHAVVVFRTEVHFATHGVRALVVDAVFKGFDDSSRVEGAGALDGIGPQQHDHVGVVLWVTRDGAVLLLVGFNEVAADLVLHAFGPPEHHRAEHAFHDLGANFFEHVGREVRHAHLHVLEHAELVGLLGGVHRVSTVVVVDENVGTTVGDVQHPGAVVGRAQRVDLRVVDRGPALLLSELFHVVVNRVPVVVVGHQVDGLHVLAILLGENRSNRLGSRVGVVAQAEAVATAVLAGRVAGTTDDREVQGLGAFAGVLQRDGHRAADATRNHHCLVLTNEAGGGLHGAVGLGFGVAHGQHDLLAQNALLGERRNLPYARVTLVDHFGSQLEARALTCPFGRVRACEVKRQTGDDGVTGDTGGIVAQRRVFLLLSPGAIEDCGKRQSARYAGGGFHECATTFGTTVHYLSLLHCMSPWDTTRCCQPVRSLTT